MAKKQKEKLKKISLSEKGKNDWPDQEGSVLQQVLDMLPLAIFWKDRQSVNKGCNKAFAKVAGMKDTQEIINKTDYEMSWTKEEADFFRECDRRVMDTNKSEENIIETLQTKDGDERWLETSKVPIEKDGEVVGILGFFQDITEKKKIEDDKIYQQKMDDLGVIAGGIAHDFNNSLAVILTSAQLAKRQYEKGKDINHLLEKIESSIKRSSLVTKQFLTFSKGGQSIKNFVDPKKMIDELKQFIKGSVRGRFDIKIDDNLFPINIDEGQIHQVLNNLVINAIQAPKDGQDVDITVSAFNVKLKRNEVADLTNGSYIIFEIKDNGTGIPKDKLDSIFDAYYTTKKEGSGLGLASCMKIVSNHNGHIVAKSKLGEGTTFSIYLPSKESFEMNGDEYLGSDKVIQGKSNILYLEDEELTRVATTGLLTELGHNVISFGDVDRAINFLNDNKDIDIVITDYIFEGLSKNGQDMLNFTKKYYPHIPVLLVTGYYEKTESKEDFDHILRKPVGIGQLSQGVSMLISKKQKNKKAA